MHLGPIVPRVDTEAGRVLAKRLMQDANHDDPAFGPGRGFRQFLEEVDIVANAQRGGFKEFAHLVDDDEDAFMLFGFGGLAKVHDQA